MQRLLEQKSPSFKQGTSRMNLPAVLICISLSAYIALFVLPGTVTEEFPQVQLSRRMVGCSPLHPPIRMLQLNCFAHAYCKEETAATYHSRMRLHKDHILALLPGIIVLEEVDNLETAPDRYSLPADIIGTCSEQGLADYRGIHGQKLQSGKDQTWVIFNEQVVELLQAPTVVQMPEGANQFAIICVFQQKTQKSVSSTSANAASEGEHSNNNSPLPFVFVAQHCKAGRNEESESLRIAHSKFLLNELVRMAPELIGVHQRLIWAGDFNAGPHSYNGKYPARWYPQVIMSRSAVDSASSSATTAEQAEVETKKDDDNSWVNTVVPLVSVYVAGRGAEPDVTTYKMREGQLICQTIDFIFIARRGGFTVTAVLDAAPIASFPETLPSVPFWGSDHLSLCADVAV